MKHLNQFFQLVCTISLVMDARVTCSTRAKETPVPSTSYVGGQRGSCATGRPTPASHDLLCSYQSLRRLRFSAELRL